MSKGVLYTCDLICYGVASPAAFQDYIALLEKHSGKVVEQYIHRGFGLMTGEGAKVVYEDGAVEQNTPETNLWSRLWYHYLVRESCYHCKYHSLERPGNITIGDYWGVEKTLPGFKDEWGVSCILVNDGQGLALPDQAKGHLELHKTSVSDVANAMQPMLFKQPEDDRQNMFWKAYDKSGFEGACKSLGFLGCKKSIEAIRRIVPSAFRLLLSALREKASVDGKARINKTDRTRKGADNSECGDESSEASIQRNYPSAFAAKHSSEAIRKQSSSGGAFYALAQTIINQGGVVYGCAFDESHKAQHIRCETMDEVVRCMGSKYSQSDLGDSLEKTKEDINAGRNVLFTGTPCQIAAARFVCEKQKKTLNAKASKLFNSPGECCGCMACMALCPQGAIEMRADSKGFMYPHIISNLCTGCMKCMRLCSFKTKQEGATDFLRENEGKEERCR